MKKLKFSSPSQSSSIMFITEVDPTHLVTTPSTISASENTADLPSISQSQPTLLPPPTSTHHPPQSSHQIQALNFIISNQEIITPCCQVTEQGKDTISVSSSRSQPFKWTKMSRSNEQKPTSPKAEERAQTCPLPPNVNLELELPGVGPLRSKTFLEVPREATKTRLSLSHGKKKTNKDKV